MNACRSFHRTLFIALSTSVLLSACTYRGVYEGLQYSERNECMKLPLNQQQECLDRVNTPYRDYEREREAQIEE
ncbi:hypothetical protein NF212_03345 [Parasalinivibrio latis]|uniref:hypothetical protein n=1 Tax=Parasalinivibrio latis TaxID=2952610 RepID=UPI0030E21E09